MKTARSRLVVLALLCAPLTAFGCDKLKGATGSDQGEAPPADKKSYLAKLDGTYLASVVLTSEAGKDNPESVGPNEKFRIGVYTQPATRGKITKLYAMLKAPSGLVDSASFDKLPDPISLTDIATFAKKPLKKGVYTLEVYVDAAGGGSSILAAKGELVVR